MFNKFYEAKNRKQLENHMLKEGLMLKDKDGRLNYAVAKVYGGYHIFLSYTDYKIFKSQK